MGILKCEDLVYLFDTHSRDAYERHVPDGYSVLLRFHNMSDLSRFIISTYSSLLMTSLQYEIQFFKIIIINNQNLMQSTFTQFRRQHILKRKYNAPASTVNLSQTFNAEKYVRNFVQLIKQGPTCICVLCNRCLYKSNAVSFVIEKYSPETI